MRLYIIVAVAVAVALCSCSDNEVPSNFAPVLTVDSATDVTRTEATLTGHVELQGEASMPTLSFSYGVSGQTTRTTVQVTPSGGVASTRVTDLKAGTQYEYWLSGTNGRVTINSKTMTFTTVHNSRPTVGALKRLSQGPMSVIVSYDITDDGGETITSTGCYVTDEATGQTTQVSATAVNGKGTYRVSVGGLSQKQAYTLQAYAVTRAGESVGESLRIETGDAVVLEEEGELSELIGTTINEYKTITIVGRLNGDDLRCLRKMAGRDFGGVATDGQLEVIDMTDATIVEGGGSYDGSRFSANDVIGQDLFSNCDKLKTIVLPNSVVTVERNAFAGCSSLTSLSLPSNVASISPSSGCTALESIDAAASTNYTSVDGVLFNSDGTEIVWFPIGKKGDYTMPSTVTSIGDRAFQECRITRFVLPDGLMSLGQAVFYGSEVEEVILPAQLRTIPTATFQNCASLTTVHLGEKAELVSDYVFDGCPLTDLYVDAVHPPVCNSNTFTTSGTSFLTTCTLHVPAGTKTIYRNHSYWGKFKKITENQ